VFRSAKASSGRITPAPATFSRKCATDDVPGISRMFVYHAEPESGSAEKLAILGSPDADTALARPASAH
jgi:hypothetical protein